MVEELLVRLKKIVDQAGIQVEFVDITQIMMTQQMQLAMAQATMSKKYADSARISAEAEVKGSELLKQAGDIMNQNKSSIHLKYFETLRDIASNWNHTVILPDGMVYVPK